VATSRIGGSTVAPRRRRRSLEDAQAAIDRLAADEASSRDHRHRRESQRTVLRRRRTPLGLNAPNAPLISSVAMKEHGGL
jgi:hypothetical protein